MEGYAIVIIAEIQSTFPIISIFALTIYQHINLTQREEKHKNKGIFMNMLYN